MSGWLSSQNTGKYVGFFCGGKKLSNSKPNNSQMETNKKLLDDMFL